VRSTLPWVVAAASGAALWVWANLAQGSQEPWDGESYWTVYLPLAGGLCFVLGFGFPERPWRWPVAVMLAQLPVMFAFTGEMGVFIMLGVVLLLILSVVGMWVSWLGAVARRAISAGSGK
jgi:hypothetical protein